MKKILIFSLLILSITLTCCFQVHTDNPEKAFKYWTRIPLPDSEVEVLKGKYWQSGHFTLEYEAYFELVASKEWRNELIRLNDLSVDTTEWYCPKDIPGWFFPSRTLYNTNRQIILNSGSGCSRMEIQCISTICNYDA
jgi:hypothetical protein